jgi:two-component system, LuxR family, sensor kinase FixL
MESSFALFSPGWEKGFVTETPQKIDGWTIAHPRTKAVIAGLIAFVVLGGSWWVGHLWYRKTLLVEAHGDVQAELDPYSNALTIDLRRRFDLVYGLGAWVSTHATVADMGANFATFARQLTQGIAGIRNLNIAPGGIIRFVYPQVGNEGIIGRDLINDSRAEIREAVTKAISSRRLAVSGPVELMVGGSGVVAHLAIYRDESFWGLIDVALDIAPILDEVGIARQMTLQSAMRNGRGQIFFGAPALFESSPVIHSVDLPDGRWELAAIPLMGWSKAIEHDLSIFDTGALACVLLLSAIVYLLAFRDARLNIGIHERTQAFKTELSLRGEIETQLTASQDRYKILVELNPDAITVNVDNKIVFANRAAVGLFGAKSLSDLLGRSPLDFVNPDDRAEVKEFYQRVLATGQASLPTIQPRRRLDGSLVYIEAVAAPIEWEGDKALQIIKRDVTEQRRAEGSLRSMIETTQDAVISINRQAHIVMFNPAAERIFGYNKAEVAGQKVNVLMAEPYATEHDGYLAHYEATGEARAIGRIRTVSARRKGGDTFPIELSVTQVASGEEVNYAAFIRDISEKVKLQEQTVENERLATIGTMAAKFGHELGNPLNGMSLTIQLLEQRLRRQAQTFDEQVAATLTRLKSEISRLNSLLQDFRSLSRKETYNFESTSLNQLVGEAIEIELPRYLEQGVEVESIFSADLPPVMVDIDKMKQVILNLAKNAVEAMPHGGKLSFKGVATSRAVTLEVSDTGAGVPAHVDIFEPFFTTKSFGTGIGMTIVRQIVAAHGGSITYRSEPGKGTTFSISLPVG